MDDDRAIGEAAEEADAMIDDAKCHAVRAQVAEHLVEVADFILSESAARFVQQQQLRLAHQRHRHPKHLFAAIRQGARALIAKRLQSAQPQDVIDALRELRVGASPRKERCNSTPSRDSLKA